MTDTDNNKKKSLSASLTREGLLAAKAIKLGRSKLNLSELAIQIAWG